MQPITDVNNHEPMFNRKEYQYHFGMPIKAGALLTNILEIYAVDVDYTNTKVEFSIDVNDYIEISYKGTEYLNRKIHYATLTTKKDIPAKQNMVLTIKVTVSIQKLFYNTF